MSQTRRKIDTGIYQDSYGIRATVKVGTLQHEKRFALDTSIKTIKGWRDETRVALRKIAPTATRGTFAADAARYLKAVPAMPTYSEREKHIALWTAEFGPRARYTLTTADVDAVLSRWLNAKLSPATPQSTNGAAAPVEPPGRAGRAEPRPAVPQARPARTRGPGVHLSARSAIRV